VLGKFTRKDEADSGLDFAGRDGRLLGVSGKFCKSTRRVSKLIMTRDQLRHVLEASVAIRSKISLTKLFKIAIALFEIPVSGWTCLRTGNARVRVGSSRKVASGLTLVDVGGVGLLSDLLSLLLLAIASSGRLGGLLSSLRALSRLSRSLGGGGSRGLAGSRGGFGCHWYDRSGRKGDWGERWRWWLEGKLKSLASTNARYIYRHVTLSLFGSDA
jgi:hypothetical protein